MTEKRDKGLKIHSECEGRHCLHETKMEALNRAAVRSLTVCGAVSL